MTKKDVNRVGWDKFATDLLQKGANHMTFQELLAYTSLSNLISHLITLPVCANCAKSRCVYSRVATK